MLSLVFLFQFCWDSITMLKHSFQNFILNGKWLKLNNDNNNYNNENDKSLIFYLVESTGDLSPEIRVSKSIKQRHMLEK